MKKILSIVVLLISLSLNAQGNLQFNQVVLIQATASASSNTNTTLQSVSVPAGKVWKIEHASLIQDPNGNRATSALSCDMYLDNVLVIGHENNARDGNKPNPFPLWLPEGTYQLTVYQATGLTLTYSGSLSAIEFNVVP